MRVIALRTLKRLLDDEPSQDDAREPTLAWYQHVRQADWSPTITAHAIVTRFEQVGGLRWRMSSASICRISDNSAL